MPLAYDELTDDPQGVLAGILAKLGLDPVLARSVEMPTARLADAESLKWRRRFEAGG